MDVTEFELISKALADPYRVKIMEAVKKERDWFQCGAVMEMFELAQSTVSHHIKQLIEARLLIAERDGRTTRFRVNHQAFQEYVDYLKRFL